MHHPPPGDAVARLTSKERECLERWLRHATAKEIALDLGVSHHTVEKRLKSARQKLGVATSLEAARLLEAAQDAENRSYGRAASHPPEVAAPPATAHTGPVGRTVASKFPSPCRRPWIIGATIMSLTLLALVAFTPFTMQSTAQRTQEVRVIDTRSSSPANVNAVADETFARLDANGSGFIEGSELANVSISTVRLSRTPDTPISTGKAFLVDADADKDGRVSKGEYRQHFAAMANAARK